MTLVCNVSCLLCTEIQVMMSRTMAINHDWRQFPELQHWKSLCPNTPAAGQVVSLMRLRTRSLSPARLATVNQGLVDSRIVGCGLWTLRPAWCSLVVMVGRTSPTPRRKDF